MVEARKSCATSEVDGILQNSAIARQIMGDRGRCKEIVGGKNGEEWGIRACRSCNGDTPTGRRRSGPTMWSRMTPKPAPTHHWWSEILQNDTASKLPCIHEL